MEYQKSEQYAQPTKSTKGSFRLLLIILVILVVALLAVVAFLLLGNGGKEMETRTALPLLDDMLLRPSDMDVKYHIDAGKEVRMSNSGLTYELGQAQSKQYIADTGRVDGWRLEMRRTYGADLAPAVINVSIEVFETTDGAQLAITPKYFKAYDANQDRQPTFLDEKCNVGDKCILYMFEKYDAAQQVTTERYEVAYTYRNFLVWVSTIGLDMEVSEQDALDIAQTILGKIKAFEAQQ